MTGLGGASLPSFFSPVPWLLSSPPSPIPPSSLSEMPLRRLLLMFYAPSLWKERGKWEKGRKAASTGFKAFCFNAGSYGSSQTTLFRHCLSSLITMVSCNTVWVSWHGGFVHLCQQLVLVGQLRTGTLWRKSNLMCPKWFLLPDFARWLIPMLA